MRAGAVIPRWMVPAVRAIVHKASAADPVECLCAGGRARVPVGVSVEAVDAVAADALHDLPRKG